MLSLSSTLSFSIFLASMLLGCSKHRLPEEQNSDTLGNTPLAASAKHRFDLFKLVPNGSVGVWKKVKYLDVPSQKKQITIMLHGFSLGDRSIARDPTKDDVSRQFGLTDFTGPNPIHRFPPPSRNAGDIYALMWDSRAGNPWELEHLLLGGTWAPRLPGTDGEKAGNLKKFLASDEIDNEEDTDFFKDLYDFYKSIFKNTNGAKITIAGFSKGGHVAIKLASNHLALSSSPLNALALLDAYVGPKWANGDLGSKLLKDIRQIKARKTQILNFRTSKIYDLALLNIKLSDKEFIDQLGAETNEIWIRPNRAEETRFKNLPSIPAPPFATEVFRDHFRAPQYFLLSSLLCDMALPTIVNPRASQPNLSFETPHQVTDWIYSGFVRNPSAMSIGDLKEKGSSKR